MVNTIKFSQFNIPAQGDATTETVGLASGVNIKIPKTTTWTILTRPGTILNPIPPYDGLLGFNTDLVQYEFWSVALGQWIQLSSSVNLNATFILKTPDLTLPNSFPLSSLATGILKSTTGTGNLSISAPLTSIDSLVTVANEILYTTAPDTYAVTTLTPFSRGLLADVNDIAWRTSLGVPGIPVNVAQGGTGKVSFTPFSVIVAGTTATNPFQNVSGVGVAGQALTSNGPGLLPTWQTPASSGSVNPGLINEVAYYAANGDTVSGLPTAASGVLVTDNAGVPSISNTIPLVTQLNITELGTITTGVWNGTIIDLAHGGTNNNLSLVVSDGGIVYSTATELNILAATATANQILMSGANAAPSWSLATYPSGPGTAGTILRSNGTNWVNSTAVFSDTYFASNILYSNGANNVVGLATGNNGILITSAGGVPSIAGILPIPVQTNITQLSTITVGVWNASTIDVAHGGTGDTSFLPYSVLCGGTVGTNPFQSVASVGLIGQVLTSQGPGVLPTWANAPGTGTINSGAINDLAYYAAPGTTISPIATSNDGVLVTSGTGVPSILAGPGVTGKVLQSNAAAAPSFSTATYPSIATSTGTILRADGTNWVASTSTFADTYAANSLLYASSANVVTGLATAASAVLTTVASVPTWAAELSLALGGTNAALVADNGGIVYSTATELAILAHTTTAGLALLSGNAAAPTWSTSPPITQIHPQSIIATGAFNYAPTAGTKYAIFELQGGGGGSGGSTGAGGQSAVGGGGGSGAYMKILVTGAANLAAITGSVGVGGLAGTSGNNPGGAGGDTTLVINGGSTWTAAGGGGGGGKASSASIQISGTAGAGGAPTTGTNGTLIFNVNGQSAIAGLSVASAATTPIAGAGGASQLGRGGAANGETGGLFGGGASGRSNASGGSVAGFAGGQGCVFVTEFISV